MWLQVLVVCSFLLMSGIPPTLLMDDLGHLSFPFCKMGGKYGPLRWIAVRI